jgi:predicted nucleic acid-binding Zn ribbon protein
MATPYSADQMGSLLRLPELLQARMAHKQGHMTLEQLRQVEDLRETRAATSPAPDSRAVSLISARISLDSPWKPHRHAAISWLSCGCSLF